MEFRFETIYDQKSMTAMAKALRKTIRKKRSRRSHILGWCVVALGMILLFTASETTTNLILTLLAVLAIVAVLIWEDPINGYVAKRRGLPGLTQSIVTFREDGYHSETAIGSSDFSYGTIMRFVETKAYFVFVFSQSHAQIYSKKTITGGTVEEFRAFITNATGKEIQKV